MQQQNFKALEGETDYFFMPTAFTHEGVFYKAAIAEELASDAEATGNYTVLLQSENGTQVLTLMKDEQGWMQVSEHGDNDLVQRIGTLIEQARL